MGNNLDNKHPSDLQLDLFAIGKLPEKKPGDEIMLSALEFEDLLEKAIAKGRSLVGGLRGKNGVYMFGGGFGVHGAMAVPLGMRKKPRILAIQTEEIDWVEELAFS